MVLRRLHDADQVRDQVSPGQGTRVPLQEAVGARKVRRNVICGSKWSSILWSFQFAQWRDPALGLPHVHPAGEV